MLHDGCKYYSYNASSGNIELMYTSNKIATKREAHKISGIGNYGSEGNKAILKSEIDSFGCRLVPGIAYASNQCVKLSDLVRMPTEAIIVSRSYTHTGSGGQLEIYCSGGADYIDNTRGLQLIIGFYNNETCSGAAIETQNATLLLPNSYHVSISRLSSGAKIEGYYTKILTVA